MKIKSANRLCLDGQSEKQVNRVMEDIITLLMPGENLKYIAFQRIINFSFFRSFIVLTNKRVIFCKRDIFGLVLNFTDFKWLDIEFSHIEESLLGSRFKVKDIYGNTFKLRYIPKLQARGLYTYAQTMEYDMYEERRDRKIEEDSAIKSVISHEATKPTRRFSRFT